MPIRVTVERNGWEQAKTVIRRLDRMLKRDTDQYALAGLRGAAIVFGRNYKAEGKEVGGWEGLKASTRAERREMGFGDAHPILVRYEDLRIYTTTQLEGVRGAATFARTDNDGGTIRVDVSPKRGAVNVTASGSKAVHQVGRPGMAARPYWFANARVAEAARKEAVFEIAKDLRRL
jgi:hypothetical protein